MILSIWLKNFLRFANWKINGNVAYRNLQVLPNKKLTETARFLIAMKNECWIEILKKFPQNIKVSKSTLTHSS